MTGRCGDRPIDILLIEDSPGDVRLTIEAFDEADVPGRLHVATDAVEAMAMLRQDGPDRPCLRPDLVLLDLNLPGKDGREVLAEIKGDPELCDIPVVVLTSSGDEQDVTRAYDLRANCYLVKPAGYPQFLEMVRRVESFWRGVVRPPVDGA